MFWSNSLSLNKGLQKQIFGKTYRDGPVSVRYKDIPKPVVCDTSGVILLSNGELNDYSYTIKYSQNTYVTNSNDYLLSLTITNTSINKWNSKYEGKYSLAVSYKIVNKDKKHETAFIDRVYLPKNVEPGESVQVPILVKGLMPGKNVVTVSMVQELVAWFHDRTGVEYSVVIERE